MYCHCTRLSIKNCCWLSVTGVRLDGATVPDCPNRPMYCHTYCRVPWFSPIACPVPCGYAPQSPVGVPLPVLDVHRYTLPWTLTMISPTRYGVGFHGCPRSPRHNFCITR